MLDGKWSVCIDSSIAHRAILVPFEGLTLWQRLLEVVTAQVKWKKGLHWLDEVEKKESLKEDVSRVRELLARAQWDSHVHGLKSDLEFTDMAGFLSRDWLTGSHVNAMLRLASIKLSKKPELANAYTIAVSSLSQALAASPDLKANHGIYLSKVPKVVCSHGQQLEGSSKTIWTASHSPGHWFATKISITNREISWGDSLG
ncbi:hypothetical protein PQX77_005609 [Marasmius sp. AFHP31]|nr:hypothetical protein PQX77_005609 [Marasmius sp. AFHP31]